LILQSEPTQLPVVVVSTLTFALLPQSAPTQLFDDATSTLAFPLLQSAPTQLFDDATSTFVAFSSLVGRSEFGEEDSTLTLPLLQSAPTQFVVVVVAGIIDSLTLQSGPTQLFIPPFPSANATKKN